MLFGRAPESFCPPDYRFDDSLETRRGGARAVDHLQGEPERGRARAGAAASARPGRARFPDARAGRFYLPPRIAFEPRGDGSGARPAWARGRAPRAREAWRRRPPGDRQHAPPELRAPRRRLVAGGRAALRTLLERLCADGAVFLTDDEVRLLAERGVVGARAGLRRGALLRHFGVPRETDAIRGPPEVRSRGPRHAAGRGGRGAGRGRGRNGRSPGGERNAPDRVGDRVSPCASRVTRGAAGRWSRLEVQLARESQDDRARSSACAPHARGELLDVGCGSMPFAPLFCAAASIRYLGVDLPGSPRFLGARDPTRLRAPPRRCRFATARSTPCSRLSMLNYLPEPLRMLAGGAPAC